MARSPWFREWAFDWLGSAKIAMLGPMEEYALLRLRMNLWTSDKCLLPDDDAVLLRLTRLNECGLDADEKSKCLANAKHLLSKCLDEDGRPMLFDLNLKQQWDHLNGISEVRASAGRRGGSSKKSGTKVPKAKRKQTSSVSVSESRSEDLENGEPQLRPKITGQVELTQYGKEYFRTTPSEYAELVDLFGLALVEQEVPQMDVWIAKSPNPSARNYRKPDHNHYLFARTTWLPGKKLKAQPTRACNSQADGFEQLRREVRQKLQNDSTIDVTPKVSR